MGVKHIHMLGICGTGMGSLAALLKEKGFSITGSDENVYPPMSTQLEGLGIKLFSGYRKENINNPPSPPFTKGGIMPDLVIIGNVISRGNPEAEAVLARNIPYLSMSQAISKFFLGGRHSIVVTGTHGKTTISTLCAWILESAGLNPGFLIGGVGKNLKTSARIGQKPYFVIEGDEYDTAFFDKGPKFLHYQPKSVILGPVEFDHADIYQNLAHVMSSFEKLIAIIPKDGLFIACADSENTVKLVKNAKCRVVTYGISTTADYHPEEIQISEEGTTFKLNYNPPSPPFRKGGNGGIFTVPMFGNHNLQNTLGALGLLMELGIDIKKLSEGLKTFKGIKRRQEIRGMAKGIIVIDDFAHHPTAIHETINAMRMQYPKRRLMAIFEPRSNTSKQNIFQNEFIRAFLPADISIIASPFKPEKVPEGKRLDVEKLVKDINLNGKKAYHFDTTDKIVEFVIKEAKTGDVILIMSNGSFDNIHEKILTKLKK